MRPEYDLAVIGGGAGGLTVAAAGAQLGAKVILIEKAAELGGECLHFGCVPSKSLIHVASIAQNLRSAELLGIKIATPEFKMATVMGQVQKVISRLQPHDSVERFEGLGCAVLVNSVGSFSDEKTFVLSNGKNAGRKITARYFVITSGSRPATPKIEGLNEVEYFTNETIFKLQKTPKKLIVIGGGPIGIELAQAFQRLGSQVTVIIGSGKMILPKDDPEAAQVVLQKLTAEGVEFVPLVRTEKISTATDGQKEVIVRAVNSGEMKSYFGDTVLIATGRTANTAGLELEKTGATLSEHGIMTNQKLQTANKRIYACGDVTGPYQFTHMAGYQAAVVLTNIFSPIAWKKVDYRSVPWVTYTDPELAQIGYSEAQAKKEGIIHQVYRHEFLKNDRAETDEAPEGFIKVICDRKKRVIGSTIVGKSAGELLGTWVVAVQKRLKITNIANMVFPYPTLGKISKQVAREALKESFTPWKKKLLKKLLGLRGK